MWPLLERGRRRRVHTSRQAGAPTKEGYGIVATEPCSPGFRSSYSRRAPSRRSSPPRGTGGDHLAAPMPRPSLVHPALLSDATTNRWSLRFRVAIISARRGRCCRRSPRCWRPIEAPDAASHDRPRGATDGRACSVAARHPSGAASPLAPIGMTQLPAFDVVTVLSGLWSSRLHGRRHRSREPAPHFGGGARGQHLTLGVL